MKQKTIEEDRHRKILACLAEGKSIADIKFLYDVSAHRARQLILGAVKEAITICQ